MISFQRAAAALSRTTNAFLLRRRLKNGGTRHDANQFKIALDEYPAAIERMIAHRIALSERIASGDAEAVDLLDKAPTTSHHTRDLYNIGGALLPKQKRRTWGGRIMYGRVGRWLKDGDPMFLIDRAVITDYYAIRTAARALEVRGYVADWKTFRKALDKGMAYDLAQEFDSIKTKRAAGDEGWRDDYYGFEHRLGYLALTAPHKPDFYRAITRMGRDYLEFADMAVDYAIGEIKERLSQNNSFAVMNNLRVLHHLYRSTMDGAHVPQNIKDVFQANKDVVAGRLYTAAGGKSLDEFLVEIKGSQVDGKDIAVRPASPYAPAQGKRTAAYNQARLLQIVYNFTRPRLSAQPA